MYNFNRGQYGKPDLTDRQARFGAQVGMWWLYFKWQWIRDAHGDHQFAQAMLAAVFLVLGLIGGWVHLQRDRRSFWYFGSLMFTHDAAAHLLPELQVRRIAGSDLAGTARGARPRLFLPLELLGVGRVGGTRPRLRLGIDRRTVRRRGGESRPRDGARAQTDQLAIRSPILLLAVVPLFANWHSASRAGQRDTRDFAEDLLNSVEPYGVLVTVGDNDTFPLWYAQEVEGIRQDVVVANTSLLNTDWYMRQMIRRPIFAYDAAKGPAIYRGQQWVKPTTAPIHMSMDEADSVPAYYPLNSPMAFTSGALKATIDPKNLDHSVLQRADLFVLRMIQDAWPQRPIYFARTSGGYARSLGLGDDVLTQGLASKLFLPPTGTAKDTVYVQGDGWLDVPRSDTLWNKVFVGPQSVLKTGDWIDRPSVGIPYLYVATGLELAEALKGQGNLQAAQQVFNTSKNIAVAVRLDDLIRPAEAEFKTPLAGDTARGTPLVAPKAKPTPKP